MRTSTSVLPTSMSYSHGNDSISKQKSSRIDFSAESLDVEFDISNGRKILAIQCAFGMSPLILIAMTSGSKSDASGWVILGFMIMAGLYFGSYMSLKSQSCRVTSTDIIVTQGWFTKSEKHLPVEEIQEIFITQGLFEQMVGVQSLAFETSTYKRSQLPAFQLFAPMEPDQLRTFIMTKRELALNSHGRVAHIPTYGASNATTNDLPNGQRDFTRAPSAVFINNFDAEQEIDLLRVEVAGIQNSRTHQTATPNFL